MQRTALYPVSYTHLDVYKRQAGRILREGGLVAFPTETVYGLGADALNEHAAQKIYAAKGRPSDNPLIIHITSMDDLAKITSSIPVSYTHLGPVGLSNRLCVFRLYINRKERRAKGAGDGTEFRNPKS